MGLATQFPEAIDKQPLLTKCDPDNNTDNDAFISRIFHIDNYALIRSTTLCGRLWWSEYIEQFEIFDGNF